MEHYTTNDGYQMAYQVHGSSSLPYVILLHGFTGSSAVWSRNIPTLSTHFHLIIPDLRGHGSSAKTRHGYHVSRLAMDLHNLLNHLKITTQNPISCIAGSLGCAILWSYSELFTPEIFNAMIWIDQSPMQNYALDGTWGPLYGNRNMNNEAAVKQLQETLSRDPEEVYKSTVASCLGYRSHPLPIDDNNDQRTTSKDDNNSSNNDNARQTQTQKQSEEEEDETFFVTIAKQGNPQWYGDLMANHTSLDWRDVISSCFQKHTTRILVIASSRSGCFPAEGPMKAVELINNNNSSITEDEMEKMEEKEKENGKLKDEENEEKKRAREKGHDKGKIAEGVVVGWGGHWCYWEDPERFDKLVLGFLKPGWDIVRDDDDDDDDDDK